MHSRSTFMIALALAAAAALPLSAQRVDTAGVGERVRVTAPALHLRRRAGTLEPPYADTVFVRIDDALVAIPRAELSRIEVAAGEGPRPVATGSLIGLVVGGLAGAVVGVTCLDDCPNDIVAFATAGGAVAGALAGAAVGAMHRSDAWSPVEPPRPAARPEGRRGRSLALGLSLPAP